MMLCFGTVPEDGHLGTEGGPSSSEQLQLGTCILVPSGVLRDSQQGQQLWTFLYRYRILTLISDGKKGYFFGVSAALWSGSKLLAEGNLLHMWQAKVS